MRWPLEAQASPCSHCGRWPKGTVPCQFSAPDIQWVPIWVLDTVLGLWSTLITSLPETVEGVIPSLQIEILLFPFFSEYMNSEQPNDIEEKLKNNYVIQELTIYWIFTKCLTPWQIHYNLHFIFTKAQWGSNYPHFIEEALKSRAD